MKYDLDKIRKSYFKSGVENAKIGNNLILNFKKQIFSSVNLYLIFTATLFFFLQNKLNDIVLLLPIKDWIVISIICGSLSLLAGLISLREEHKNIVAARQKFLKKSNQIFAYIKKYNIREVEEIPYELCGVIEKNDIFSKSSRVADVLTMFQIAFFVISTGTDVVAVIGAIS